MKREEDFDMADQAYQEGRAEADTEVHQLRELLVKADAEIRRLKEQLEGTNKLASSYIVRCAVALNDKERLREALKKIAEGRQIEAGRIIATEALNSEPTDTGWVCES